MYSLGCVLYFLLTRELLSQPLHRVGAFTERLQARLGIDIADLLCGMLSSDQYDRLFLAEVLEHTVFSGKSLTSF